MSVAVKGPCAVKGSWELEEKSEHRRKKKQAKKSYFSGSFNATNFKAKYSPDQRINRLDTDMCLKGKHTFSILQTISIQALVYKSHCKCPTCNKRTPVQGVNIFSSSINSLSGDFMSQNIKATVAKSVFHLVFIYEEDPQTPNFSGVISTHICYRGY